MTPQRLVQLSSSTIDDVRIVGFLDCDEAPPRFCPQLRQLYFELSGVLLELSCIEDTGTLQMSICQQVGPPVETDEDLPVCSMSIAELVLSDPDAENQVASISVWGAGFGEECATCSAMEFELENGQVIFVDPTYHFGIKTGSARQRATWFENWPDAHSTKVWRAAAPFQSEF